MFESLKRRAALLPVLVLAGAGAAHAGSPIGTWVDHTGRGAVEITACGNAVCGKVVWVKSAADKDGCNIQVIGNVKPVGARWDGGWIYDPEKGEKYDVELTPVGDNKLKVLGYMGMKMFGETMMWTRAPASLERCDQPARSASAAPLPAPARVAGEPGRAVPSRVASVTPTVPASEPPPAAETAEAAPAPAPEPAPVQPAGKPVAKSGTCSFDLPQIGRVSMPCNTAKKIVEWLQ